MLSPDLIHHLLEQYGYFILFLVEIVEGPIVTIIAAFIASQGYFDIYAVFAVAVIGDLFGDIIYYGIGRAGAPAGIWSLLGITEDRLVRAGRYFERHGAKMLLFAKYTQTGIVILPASGAARMPVGKFLWYNLLGTIPKTMALLLIGYFFGYAYKSIDNDLTRGFFLFAGILCLTGLYLLVRRYVRVNYDEG